MNWELTTRIDNRLIHGQVGMTWVSTLGVKMIVVADDLVANDVMTMKLMSSIVRTSGATLRFFRVDDLAKSYASVMEGQKVLLVLRSLEELIRLIEAGMPIESVNIGNIHYTPDRKQFTKKVYVNERDVEILNRLLDREIDLYIQDVPGALKTVITKKLLGEIRFGEK